MHVELVNQDDAGRVGKHTRQRRVFGPEFVRRQQVRILGYGSDGQVRGQREHHLLARTKVGAGLGLPADRQDDFMTGRVKPDRIRLGDRV